MLKPFNLLPKLNLFRGPHPHRPLHLPDSWRNKVNNESNPVYVRGDFFFDCDDDYECDDTATIAYDFKRKRFVPVGTKGSLVIGAELLPTPKSSTFVGVALNG